jgi:hypothetical protein
MRTNSPAARHLAPLFGREEFQDPVVYFAMVITTDTIPDKLISRVVHEWHRLGGVCLQIKELQTFESGTILSLFKIFTATNKKILPVELHEILTATQNQVQEHDPTEFWWGLEDTAPNSSPPPLKLHHQNLNQDMSHFNKLSWQVQANQKVYHVECDSWFAMDIQRTPRRWA